MHNLPYKLVFYLKLHENIEYHLLLLIFHLLYNIYHYLGLSIQVHQNFNLIIHLYLI